MAIYFQGAGESTGNYLRGAREQAHNNSYETKTPAHIGFLRWEIICI